MERHPDDKHIYTSEDSPSIREAPVRSREECIRETWHGSGIIINGLTICFYCNTIVTEEDLAERRRRVNGYRDEPLSSYAPAFPDRGFAAYPVEVAAVSSPLVPTFWSRLLRTEGS